MSALATIFVVAALPLCLAKRTVLQAHQESGSGQHKCTISWAVKGEVARTIFAVPSCATHCKVTNSDFNHHKMYAKAFMPAQMHPRYCSCLNRTTHTPALQFVGKCGDDRAEAQAQCFKDYKILKTNTYVGGHKFIEKHTEMYHETKFQYECVKDGCANGGCDSHIWLPKIHDGRDKEEIEVMAGVLDKAARGKKLNRDEKEFVKNIPEEDADAILFNRLSPDGKPIKAGQLRKAYKAPMDKDGLDVGHVMKAADLISDDQDVDMPGFKRFQKMARAAKKNGGTLTTDEAEDTLFDDLSADGEPVGTGALRKEYTNRMKGSNANVDHSLSEADLSNDDGEVDLPAFKRFHKALVKKDADEALFDELSPDGKPVKVAKVKDAFKDRLAGDGVDVSQALTEAGLESDDQDVDLPVFKRFLKAAKKLKEMKDEAPADEEEQLFNELGDGKPMTVAKLKEKYGDELKEDGIDIGHVLKDADLSSDADEVDLPKFKKFLAAKARRQEQPREPEDEDEALFNELNGGKPTTVAKLKDKFGDELKDDGVDIGHVLKDADLTSDDQAVDLPAFKKFRAAVKKAKEEGAGSDSEEELEEELDAGGGAPAVISGPAAAAKKGTCPKTRFTVEHQAGADNGEGATMMLRFLLPRGSEPITVFCADSYPEVASVTEGQVFFECPSTNRWTVVKETCGWPQGALREMEASRLGPGACQRKNLKVNGVEHKLKASKDGTKVVEDCGGDMSGTVEIMCKSGDWVVNAENSNCFKEGACSATDIEVGIDEADNVLSFHLLSTPLDQELKLNCNDRHPKKSSAGEFAGDITFLCIKGEDGAPDWDIVDHTCEKK